MVVQGLAGLQRRLQRDVGSPVGRPAQVQREDALAVCGLCGWTKRGSVRALTDRGSPLPEQQFIWDSAYAHAIGAHDLAGADIAAMDCPDVRELLGAPSPGHVTHPYLVCSARLYAVGGADGLRTAYHEHWNRCPSTEALYRAAQVREEAAHETVYTRGAEILPGWRYVP